MSEERNQYLPTGMSLHDQCKNYAFHHVILTMNDGRTYDGIIENVGADSITVLIGEDVMERDSEEDSYNRQFYPSGVGGYGGFGGYGGYGYGYPRRRYRRFGRQILPIAALAGLALLPYAFAPFPAYPPYPYY